MLATLWSHEKTWAQIDYWIEGEGGPDGLLHTPRAFFNIFFARRYQSVQEMLRAQIIAHPTKPMIMLLPAESFLRSEKTSTMSTRDDETQKSYVYPSLLFLDEKEIKGKLLVLADLTRIGIPKVWKNETLGRKLREKLEFARRICAAEDTWIADPQRKQSLGDVILKSWHRFVKISKRYDEWKCGYLQVLASSTLWDAWQSYHCSFTPDSKFYNQLQHSYQGPIFGANPWNCLLANNFETKMESVFFSFPIFTQSS